MEKRLREIKNREVFMYFDSDFNDSQEQTLFNFLLGITMARSSLGGRIGRLSTLFLLIWLKKGVSDCFVFELSWFSMDGSFIFII